MTKSNRISVRCPFCGKGSHCVVSFSKDAIIGTIAKGLYCKKRFQFIGNEIVQVAKPKIIELND